MLHVLLNFYSEWLLVMECTDSFIQILDSVEESQI